MSKLSIVPKDGTNVVDLPSITDMELEQQVVSLLEEVRVLRHELKNKKYAYELAMKINHRNISKVRDLESTLAMAQLCDMVYGGTKKKTA